MSFRIVRFNNRSVTEFQVQFSENLDPDIGIANVRVTSGISATRDLTIKTVDITNDVITVGTSPQAALINYTVEFISTDSQPFVSATGNPLNNPTSFRFLGQERANDIRDTILNGTQSVYDVDNDTIVRKHIANVAEHWLRGRTDVRETGNSNYLSVDVSTNLDTAGDLPEEVKERGFGPNDRLLNEGAYEILRVGPTPEGTTALRTIRFNSARANALVSSANVDNVNRAIITFPSDPVSLRSVSVISETVSNEEQLTNSFDGILINVSKSNVAVLHSVVLNGTTVYDIPNYGYTLLDNKYDTVSGRKLLTLESNQIKLSDAAILQNAFPLPKAGDTLTVSYSYINDGINVDTDSVVVSQVRDAVRESVPSVITVFSLDNFPIVDASDNILTSGGVSFLDPAPATGTPFSKTHPAFQTELVYDTSRLPAQPGEYAVNYSTGLVVVYGASSNNGTGDSPPVATYKYRRIFAEGIDYNIAPDDNEIVVVPGRDLVNEEVKVTFNYEEVFAEGTDYLNESHVEVIDEFVENRIDLTNLSIIPLNVPVTNVFEIFNETTGETYAITRFNNDRIYFNGRNLPRLISRENEQASFDISTNETLFVSEELSNNGTTKIIQIDLLNENLLSFTGQKGGANVNSEKLFTRGDLFLREFFYDSVLQSVAQNLTKLSIVGDYLVNYADGIIYLLTNADQSDSIGQITYKYGKIIPRFSQVGGVNDIGYRTSVKNNRILEVNSSTFTSNDITVESLPSSVERFYFDNTSKPILFGTKQTGQAGQTTLASFEFVAPDGLFISEFEDGNHILRIPGDPDRSITSVTSENTLLVDIAFTETARSLNWCIIDFNLTDGYQVETSYEIDYISGVYTVTDLQTNDKDSLTNLFDPDLDTFDGKTITFNNTSIASVPAGTALAIDYSFGTLYTSYDYWQDVLRISYEYGDNSINWAIGDALDSGEQYFVSYRYGALREKLLENFGSLTRIEELTSFPLDFDRELYRNFLIGTLQGFVSGPTVDSIKTLVETVTDIKPEIVELTFNEWTIGRDNLHLQEPNFNGTEQYASGKFNNGLIIDGDTTLSFPAESYISHREGTFESWVKPNWSGIDNDSDITVDISGNASDIYIGSTGFSPSIIPFTLNKADEVPESPVGRPINYPDQAGHYIWFDPDTNLWNWESTTDGYGEITTSGSIYNVLDGYNLTSTDRFIRWDGYGDNQDGYLTADGYEVRNQFTFSSDDFHYLFDSGPDITHNRLSVFKDGAGYLNFRVYDDTGRRRPNRGKVYNLSHNIQSWVAGEPHFVSASWRLNTAEGIDEMHLFVDGTEVSNLFKYGGKPPTTATDIYRTVADEYLTTSASKTIIGNTNGSSTSGSTTFSALGNEFSTNGIIIGDTLTILDDTADGAGSPYTITGVGEDSLVIGTPLTLTLNNISFSVNQATFNPSTNVDVESFAIFAEDGYGERTELRGLDAIDPDYSIERSGGVNTVYVNNGVTAGDGIIVNTLGLTQGRCRDLIYSYVDGYGSNTIETRSSPPSSLTHVDVFKVIARRFSIENDGYMYGGDGYFAPDGYISVTGSQADGYFANICQPSNTVNGKAMAVTLGSLDNIDFTGTNQITLVGTTFGGSTSETLSFSSYGTQTTSNYFTSLDYLLFTFTAIDPTISFGSLQIIESIPFTQQENSGDYAEVSGYDNGTFSFTIFGSGSLPYVLEPCHYLFDYPISLNIPMQGKGELYIGSTINGDQQFDGTIDQAIFLNEMLSDVRIGEDAGDTRTITEDYNSPVPLTQTPQTLMLLNLDNSIENVELLYKTFDERFLTTSNSVNDNFGDAIVFLADEPLVLDNGTATFNNDTGTIEFWVSPIIDTLFDEENSRYYVDITSIKEEQVISDTATTLTLPNRAKEIVSIRLLGDTGTGTDYFQGGQLFVDGQTIVLGTRLPGNNTLVKVQYVPIDFNGDRVSIFKDSTGNLNFSITAGDEVFLISYPIQWKRDTWHRVMATWTTNTVAGEDKMRLFVDGVEGGTVLWGTPGLLYGTGVIYGSTAVGTAGSNALVDNIDLEDTFAEIHIGNSFDGRNPSRAKIDNLRFSNVQREPSLVGTSAVDLNYNSNLDAVFPVIEDNFTTLLLDFDRSVEQTEFLSNLLSKFTPLFTFDVNVDDSFNRISDQRSRDLMTNVINRMKPAHTNVLVRYISD